MKVIILREELLALIAKAVGIVAAKPAIPILANVLIEATADQVILSATDLTVSVRAFADAKVLEEGGITLPARRFFQLVREITAPQVEIHMLDSSTVQINAGSSHFKIQGMHKEEFPKLSDISGGAHFPLPKDRLKEMFTRTAFAAAREDARQVLNGIFIEHTEDKATFVGTDGKRLAMMKTEIATPLPSSGAYIVPLKAVEEMVKALDEKEGEARFTLMSDKIALESGSVVLISKLFAGPYPDVKRVIPQDPSKRVALHREELMSLLRQISLFTSEHSNSVRFSFTPGELHLFATSGEIGEGKVSMPVNYEGEKFEIAFNPNYFLDILRHTKDETVQFAMTDSYNPGLLTDSTDAQFVIMPMRLET